MALLLLLDSYPSFSYIEITVIRFSTHFIEWVGILVPHLQTSLT